MPYASLARYEFAQLGTMLDAYRRLADEHGQAGHYALAKWARGMCTHITIEMNARDARDELAAHRQLYLV